MSNYRYRWVLAFAAVALLGAHACGTGPAGEAGLNINVCNTASSAGDCEQTAENANVRQTQQGGETEQPEPAAGTVFIGQILPPDGSEILYAPQTNVAATVRGEVDLSLVALEIDGRRGFVSPGKGALELRHFPLAKGVNVLTARLLRKADGAVLDEREHRLVNIRWAPDGVVVPAEGGIIEIAESADDPLLAGARLIVRPGAIDRVVRVGLELAADHAPVGPPAVAIGPPVRIATPDGLPLAFSTPASLRLGFDRQLVDAAGSLDERTAVLELGAAGEPSAMPTETKDWAESRQEALIRRSGTFAVGVAEQTNLGLRTAAGGGAEPPGETPGAALATQFEDLRGLAFESEHTLYVAEPGQVSRLRPREGGVQLVFTRDLFNPADREALGEIGAIAVDEAAEGKPLFLGMAGGVVRVTGLAGAPGTLPAYEIVAGGGSATAAEGVAATAAAVEDVVAVAALPNGFAFASAATHKVFSVTAGVLHHLAGADWPSGAQAPPVNGAVPLPGTQLYLHLTANEPRSLAARADGVLLLPDRNRVLAINTGAATRIIGGIEIPPGFGRQVAGQAAAGYTGDGGLALHARFDRPLGVAFWADGGFVIADTANHVLRAVTPSGRATTIGGGAAPGSSFARGRSVTAPGVLAAPPSALAGTVTNLANFNYAVVARALEINRIVQLSSLIVFRALTPGGVRDLQGVHRLAHNENFTLTVFLGHLTGFVDSEFIGREKFLCDRGTGPIARADCDLTSGHYVSSATDSELNTHWGRIESHGEPNPFITEYDLRYPHGGRGFPGADEWEFSTAYFNSDSGETVYPRRKLRLEVYNAEPWPVRSVALGFAQDEVRVDVPVMRGGAVDFSATVPVTVSSSGWVSHPALVAIPTGTMATAPPCAADMNPGANTGSYFNISCAWRLNEYYYRQFYPVAGSAIEQFLRRADATGANFIDIQRDLMAFRDDGANPTADTEMRWTLFEFPNYTYRREFILETAKLIQAKKWRHLEGVIIDTNVKKIFRGTGLFPLDAANGERVNPFIYEFAGADAYDFAELFNSGTEFATGDPTDIYQTGAPDGEMKFHFGTVGVSSLPQVAMPADLVGASKVAGHQAYANRLRTQRPALGDAFGYPLNAAFCDEQSRVRLWNYGCLAVDSAAIGAEALQYVDNVMVGLANDSVDNLLFLAESDDRARYGSVPTHFDRLKETCPGCAFTTGLPGTPMFSHALNAQKGGDPDRQKVLALWKSLLDPLEVSGVNFSIGINAYFPGICMAAGADPDQVASALAERTRAGSASYDTAAIKTLLSDPNCAQADDIINQETLADEVSAGDPVRFSRMAGIKALIWKSLWRRDISRSRDPGETAALQEFDEEIWTRVHNGRLKFYVAEDGAANVTLSEWAPSRRFSGLAGDHPEVADILLARNHDNPLQATLIEAMGAAMFVDFPERVTERWNLPEGPWLQGYGYFADDPMSKDYAPGSPTGDADFLRGGLSFRHNSVRDYLRLLFRYGAE